VQPFPRRFPRRGEIYMVDFGQPRGSEQAGERPAVVVSNDVNNQHSPVVIVAAITRTIPSKDYSHTVYLPAGVLPSEGTILCGQLLTIDKTRLVRHRGELDEDQTEALDAALIVSLGLPKRVRPR
jgi:mRNA interferase MazF